VASELAATAYLAGIRDRLRDMFSGDAITHGASAPPPMQVQTWRQEYTEAWVTQTLDTLKLANDGDREQDGDEDGGGIRYFESAAGPVSLVGAAHPLPADVVAELQRLRATFVFSETLNLDNTSG
jgi:hypothetical protein